MTLGKNRLQRNARSGKDSVQVDTAQITSKHNASAAHASSHQSRCSRTRTHNRKQARTIRIEPIQLPEVLVRIRTYNNCNTMQDGVEYCRDVCKSSRGSLGGEVDSHLTEDGRHSRWDTPPTSFTRYTCEGISNQRMGMVITTEICI